MKILEYTGINVSRCTAQYKRVVAAIERDDFATAEVKKLVNLRHGKFYRAKLDDANRLLFAIVRHGNETYALLLEVIENHDYAKSRFLRGAEIDEDKLPIVGLPQATVEADPVRYVHPERREIHFLDKMISFDDAQEEVYRLSPPLILVGAAGSGKTALTLTKMKHVEGEVLYVTQSAYLAQSARDLYYAHGFDREGQEATFFSFWEFLESIHIPKGREAVWRDFSAWFGRMGQQFKGIEAHQAFEEIRGVITADASGFLDRETYLALGVRQSIFSGADRDLLYVIFEKYRDWLAINGLIDLNLLSRQWLEKALPRYDFIVVDEVQDLTCVQLGLILKTLKNPGQFLLCGDSNQIVHPNFFSWSKIKSLFWHDPDLANQQNLQVLRANFRNSREATRIANTLLKIKHRRFGSIDRESNFLVNAVSQDDGTVRILADREDVKKELNQKTKGSAQCAVLVLRDEDKPGARRFFHTPLLFSIHEAKGLEYDHVILYRFISGHRAEFDEVASVVSPESLVSDELQYRRAKDKADKSLEIYKFYVNALYVALTRAIKSVYLVESDGGHPLLQLLNLKTGGDQVEVIARTSTLEDWQKEARKLELQGKLEQAEAIRSTILKQAPVPWQVFDESHLRATVDKVFQNPATGAKPKQQIYEYACCYTFPALAEYLATDGRYAAAKNFDRNHLTVGTRHLSASAGRNFKDILRLCERHGVDHRNQMNQTPLMAAAIVGNLPLVEALLELGSDPMQTDNYGHNALHWAMSVAFRDEHYARGPFAAIYELIAPASIDLMVGERLVRIDRHLSEYLLLQTMWVLFKSRFQGKTWWSRYTAFDTATVLNVCLHLPPNVLKPARNKRAHLSSVLSRNEMNREYAYNRRLFMRIAQGWYLFNPALSLRQKTVTSESWTPIYTALHLPLIKEFVDINFWPIIDRLFVESGIEPPTVMSAASEQARNRQEAEEAAWQAQLQRLEAERKAYQKTRARLVKEKEVKKRLAAEKKARKTKLRQGDLF